jgi:hypothetical protein
LLNEKTRAQLHDAVAAALAVTPRVDSILQLVIQGINCTFAHLKSTTQRKENAEIMMKTLQQPACITSKRRIY